MGTQVLINWSTHKIWVFMLSDEVMCKFLYFKVMKHSKIIQTNNKIIKQPIGAEKNKHF